MIKRIPLQLRKLLLLVEVATLLILLGVACFFISALWHPSDDDQYQVLFHELFAQLWPFFWTVAAALIVYERWLRDSFISELKRVAGPQIIQTLRPRDTLSWLLAHVYGRRNETHDVVAAVLGGYGDALKDLTTSDSTTVAITLRDHTDDALYNLTFEVNYGFEHRGVPNTSFVFFVTSSAQIRDLLLVGCDHPLFDFWYLPNAGSELNIADFMASLSLRIDFVDTGGAPRTSQLFRNFEVTIVPPNDWHWYLRFFESNIGSIRKKLASEHAAELRILTFDFAALLDKADFEWRSVRGLTISSTTQQKKSDEYCYWVAPYPCFVEAITFDTSGLSPPRATPGILQFRKVPFLLRAVGEVDTWSTAPKPLKPESWLLPGHGVSLLWRSGNHVAGDSVAYADFANVAETSPTDTAKP